MKTVQVNDGDTWDALAAANDVDLVSLLLTNGLDPTASPDPPSPGTFVPLPADPPEHCIAPDHDHVLELPHAEVLWIRLDMTPDDATRELGSLRLYSDDRSFDVTVAIAESYIPDADAGTVDLHFDGVDPDGSYAVDYVDYGGARVCVVPSTPFAQFQPPT